MTTQIHTIHALLARGEGSAPALLGPDYQTVTYDGMRDAVARLVGSLRTLGVTADNRVAFVLPGGPDTALTFLAVASGATAAPLNPKYREPEFRFYLEDLAPKVLITRPGDMPEAHAAAGPDTVRVALEGEGAGLSLSVDGDPIDAGGASYAAADATALVLHTSGTTSRPKIVPLRQRNLAASATNISTSLALTAFDRCLNVMPLFHIHGLLAGLLAPLAAGGSVACPPGFDGFKFFEWLDTLEPTWYTAVPTMHQVVLSRARKQTDVIARSKLRFVRSSSASLPSSVLEKIESVFGVPMIEAYGMTEASHQMASNPLPPGVRKAGSVGVGTGIEIGIMDSVNRLLPPGHRGEVVIKGATVVEAYENNPDANAKAFVDGWFRTGDQGYFDEDGYLFLSGRLKEIINRGGEKISPLEVDEVLLRHPAVAQAVAFAMPHDRLGEDVAAAVVLNENATVTDQELRTFAAEHLADFKVPRKVVILDEIPKGPTGKVQRIGLAERLGLS